MYSASQPSELTTHWLERQARAWANDTARVAVAARMYEMRFGTGVPAGTTLQQLRGLEGQRMKLMYQMLADKHRIRGFKRNYNPANWEEQNPVNQALSAANTALYGVVHAAIMALGCSPALGFVHSGKQHAFVYDVADLYKAQHTIPMAFSLNKSANSDREARRNLRESFRLYRLMPTIVHDVQRLLDPDLDEGDTEVSDPELVQLWDPDLGPVDAGVNHAADPGW